MLADRTTAFAETASPSPVCLKGLLRLMRREAARVAPMMTTTRNSLSDEKRVVARWCAPAQRPRKGKCPGIEAFSPPRPRQLPPHRHLAKRRELGPLQRRRDYMGETSFLRST